MKPTVTYVPGVCNIGPEEIAKRKAVGWGAFAVAAALLGVLVSAGVNAWWRLFIFVPATISALGFLQAHFGFCVAYAQKGVSGMESVGNVVAVSGEDAHKKDTSKGRKIVIGAIAIGIAVAIICVII